MLEELIGKNVCVRTLGEIVVGRVVAVSDTHLKLEHAAWIADTGLWSAFAAGAPAKDVEPMASAYYANIGHAVGVTEIPHQLPMDRR